MSMTGRLLPWQQNNWQQLHQYIRQGRIPQALLIIGKQGIGKTNLAKQFAFSLLCAQPGVDGFQCGQCRYCALVAAGNHPDFIEITPEEEKKSISISQIRSVIADTSLMPQYDRYRVVLINPADLLTLSAFNAFLKCLEEPAQRTVFILITEKPSRLPATILSRCQKLMAFSPSAEMLGEWLRQNRITDERTKLVSLFNGSIVSYSQFLDNALLKSRSECFKDWQAIALQESFPAIVAEKWDKLPKIDLLNWILSWLVDMIKHKHSSSPDFLYNQDVIKSLQKLAAQLDLKSLYGLYDKLLTCREQVDMQLNFQNMLEEILVSWQEINRKNSCV